MLIGGKCDKPFKIVILSVFKITFLQNYRLYFCLLKVSVENFNFSKMGFSCKSQSLFVLRTFEGKCRSAIAAFVSFSYHQIWNKIFRGSRVKRKFQKLKTGKAA